MFWLLIAVGAIAAVILVVLITGSLLPQNHRASVSREIPAPPEQVWRTITSLRDLPNWHPEVKSVEAIVETQGKTAWRETYRNGDKIAYETVSTEPPRRLVRRIADPKLPYGGTWTLDIEDKSFGSRVTITEDGEVYNPIFRFVSRFFIGHTVTMERYLAALAQRLASAPVETASNQHA